MKRDKLKALAAAVGATGMMLVSTGAFAQSSVTLYGLIDEAIRYQTNAGPNGSNQASMGIGVETPSRWGIKGSEALSGDLSAIFRLESQFDAWDGQLASSSTMFSRMAYVGLASKRYGSVMVGRNMTPFFDTMGSIFDPLTVADYWQDSWIYNGIGPFLILNNSVKYVNDIGGLHVEGLYAFGNQAGAVGLGSSYAVELSYHYKAATLGVGFQQDDVASVAINNMPPSQTKNGAKFNLLHVSGAYQLTPSINLMAGWMHMQDRTGLTDLDMQQPYAPTLSGVSPNRIDDAFYVGGTWQATPPLKFTLAGYYDHARNAALADGTLGNGINYSGTLLGEYSLSKRTEFYGSVDFSRGNGAFTADYAGVTMPGSSTIIGPGRSNNVAVTVGLRTIF